MGAMDDQAQWVAYEAAEGAMLKAPLPSAPEVGPGWRGVELRRFHPLPQLDDLLVHTVTQVEAAIGLAAAGDGWAYAVAATRGAGPLRLILGVDLSNPPASSLDVLERCGVQGTGGRWRTSASKALAAWSEYAPRTADPIEVSAFVGESVAPHRAVEGVLQLLGMKLPGEPIPDPLDLQSVAREIRTAPQRKRRWLGRR
jgi:hypothetical protein